MNVLEDKLRTALRETGEEIVPHSVPPLRLDRARHVRLPRALGSHRWAGWLGPLAAAAAVAAVIIASTAVSGTIGSGRRPLGTSAALGGLPRYYVALRFSRHNTCCLPDQPLLPRTHAVVVDTATGAVLASVGPPPGDTFVGVTGAADDRTFVLGAQKYGTLSPTRFYLLRIGPEAATGSLLPTIAPTPASSRGPATPSVSPSPRGSATPSASPSPRGSVSPSPSGSVSPSASPSPRGSATPSASPSPRGSATLSASLSPRSPASPGPRGHWTRLSPLPVPPDMTELVNFALSPDGTSLAVLDISALHVFGLVTGAQRMWDRPSQCFGGVALGGANTDAMLSWAADSRHLATACNGGPPGVGGVWLLHTAVPGNSLTKGRLLVPGPPVAPNGQPPWNRVLLTADGRTVVGVLQVHDPHRPATLGPLQELAEFSAHTGKLLRLLNRMPVWNYVDFEQVLWASPSGKSLLVSDTKPYAGHRRAFFLLNDAGVLTGGRFTPLPHWPLNTLAAAW